MYFCTQCAKHNYQNHQAKQICSIEFGSVEFAVRQVDVCVVPSYYEPFGLVAIEAIASRTPVVASGVGALKYTV